MGPIRYFWTALIFSCFSCEPSVLFEEPQPFGGTNLPGFSTKITGTYASPEKDVFLIVSKDQVIRTMVYDSRIHKAHLDPAFLVQEGALVNRETGEVEIAKMEGDTIIWRRHFTDTLFNIAGGDILKKYKGRFYLNTKAGSRQWFVYSLDFSKDEVSLGKIRTEEDQAKLRAITGTAQDTVFRFNPTKKQFKQFVKASGFSSTESFVRLY